MPLTAASCPVCRSTPQRAVAPAEPPFQVVECTDCGLAYVDPMPDTKELFRHYDEDYYAEWISGQREKRERMWARRLRTIERLTGKGRVLDVGCGDGLFLEHARRSGWEVAGTDVSAYGAEFASKRIGQKVFCGEIWNAPFTEGRFDVITLWHVLEHSTAPMRTLQTVRRLLKPAGLLILAVPNVDDRLMQAAYLFVKRRKPRLFSVHDKEIHLLHFSVQSLRRLLSKTGFDCLGVGPDFGVVEPAKKLINHLAALLFYTAGWHWYNSIQVVARRA